MKENVLILGNLLRESPKILARINQTPKKIVVAESFISVLDYFKIHACQILIYLILRRRIKNSNYLIFQSKDVKNLLLDELQRFFETTDIRLNLGFRYAIEKFLRKFTVHTYITPYENHSWEQLTNLFIKSKYPDTKLVGYQHSSIVLKELNYFPSIYERNILPFPDKILTVGEGATSILEEFGNYPPGKLFSGCGFRYSSMMNHQIRERTRGNSILVAFPIGKEASIEILSFFLENQRNFLPYSILLKFHPVLKPEEIIKELRDPLPNNFKVFKTSSVDQLLKNADIVCFSQTTVGLEALFQGIPVICIEIDPFYPSDPIFRFNDLKWTVHNPDELVQALYEIQTMNDEEFRSKQLSARRYLERYFFPVSDDAMEKFIL